MAKDETFLRACMKAIRQQTFYNQYWKTFEVVRADTEELRRKSYRLRHKVFVEENGFLNPDHYPDGLEKDEFDAHAVHFLLMHKQSGETAGTLRLVLPQENAPLTSFEMQKHCDHPLLQIENRALGMCEISRFCMAPRFRKRARDGRMLPAYYEQDWNDAPNRRSQTPFFQRRIPFAPLGLLMAAFGAALEEGIGDCMMAYEIDQLYTFNRLGVDYRILGQRLYTQGETQPLSFNIRNALDGMAGINPECFEVAADKGRLLARARELSRHDWPDNLRTKESRGKSTSGCVL